MNLSLKTVYPMIDLNGHEQFRSSPHHKDKTGQIVEAKNQTEGQPKNNLQIANA